MPTCDVCDRIVDKVYECKYCGIQFCKGCGSVSQMLCEDCLEEDTDEEDTDEEDTDEEDTDEEYKPES